jgi:uncharacterized protein CbrC (UPF0167 family)
MDLPIFTYNPHPLKNNCIIKSDKVCQVCNKKIGYIVTSIMATAFDNIYDICPWCIADGSACRKYNGEFVYYIENAKNISKEILDTISCKTVSFPAHQELTWLTHCNDGCEFHGFATPADFQSISREERNRLSKVEYLSDIHIKELELEELEELPYCQKFVCIHCGEVKLSSDYD